VPLTEETYGVRPFLSQVAVVPAVGPLCTLFRKFASGSNFPLLVNGLVILNIPDPEMKCSHQDRLETRTKESNMYASRRVENLKA
jgi:hypothetical protein